VDTKGQVMMMSVEFYFGWIGRSREGRKVAASASADDDDDGLRL